MTTSPATSAPPLRHQDEPLVTVVIPARNEEVSIGACLDAVLAQDWPNLQVLVVDGDSEDRTTQIVAERAQRDPRVELLANPRRIIPVSLNTALARARGEHLVRIDAHAIVPGDYVRTAVTHLQTGRYGGVGGRKDGVGRTPAGRAVAAVMASRFGVGGSRYHWGTSVAEVEHVPFGAYPVALLRELGGWDEELVVNQDFELDYRIRRSGRVILFDPQLHIDWECRQSIGDFARQYHRYGGGKARVALKHPASLRPRHLAAPALVAQLVGTVLLLAARRPGLAAASVVPYLGVLAAGYVSTARQVDAQARVHLVPALLAMHLGWGVGFWRTGSRLVLGARRRQR